MYQFYACSGVSAIETVNLLAVDREDHGLPAEDALGPALLLMEGTFGPLNGSTSPKHSYSRDSRYRAVLPPALLASFGLAGSQPLSALSGPLKTMPFAVRMPPRSTLACSTNLAPRLLRGAIVPTATQEKHAPAFRLATSRSPIQPHPEVTNAMVKHGWTPETDDVFFALDVSPSYHPTNFAGIAEQELRPNYEHAGNIALELFYFAAKTETIKSGFVLYRHKCASRYSSAMAAQTLYEATHEEVVPSNRRNETLSGGIAFDGHSLGPDVLQSNYAHCLFCQESFQGGEGYKSLTLLSKHLNAKDTPCSKLWGRYRRGNARDANTTFHPYICEAAGCSRPFLTKLKFLAHLRESVACLRENAFCVNEPAIAVNDKQTDEVEQAEDELPLAKPPIITSPSALKIVQRPSGIGQQVRRAVKHKVEVNPTKVRTIVLISIAK
ncbi:hypothetical protein LTR15_000515 [Elasticomyces elasticus]|nr:hypothetical protein LTR15_000515 [Elasticomyces elasticus]